MAKKKKKKYGRPDRFVKSHSFDIGIYELLEGYARQEDISMSALARRAFRTELERIEREKYDK